MTLRKRIVRQPLYEQVAVLLKNEILRKLKPGDRLQSESKLVEQLGVSAVTLRQAISALAQEGLIERRHGSGNYVSENVRKPFVAVATQLLENPGDSGFQTRLFRMVGTELLARGHAVRHYAKPAMGPSIDWSDLQQDTRAGLVAGAAFIAMHPGDLAAAMDRKEIPFVGTAEPWAPFRLDHPSIIRNGARHLLERGCRKIALMQWAEGEPTRAAQCAQAFAEVLRQYDAPVRPNWIQQSVSPSAPGAGWEQFRSMWVTRDEKPDGLLVTDDMVLRDVAMAILDLHIKVPEQLQIVAQTNKGSGLTYPFPVTALEIDPHEIAVAMAETLTRLLNHEPAPAIREIAPELVLPKVRAVEFA